MNFRQKKTKFVKKLQTTLFRTFSVIHNYHCPYQLFCFGKVTEFDDQITNYNEYIQAFLTKRWTHKKEISKFL